MKRSIRSCRKWHEAIHGRWECPGCQRFFASFQYSTVGFDAAFDKLWKALDKQYAGPKRTPRQSTPVPDFAVLNVSVCRDE